MCFIISFFCYLIFYKTKLPLKHIKDFFYTCVSVKKGSIEDLKWFTIYTQVK